MMVKLLKQEGTYVNNEGKEKRYVNFFVECGDSRIPIEVAFFPQDKFDGRDPNYAGRREVLKAFAEKLPEKTKEPQAQVQAPEQKKPTLEAMDDDVKIPF